MTQLEKLDRAVGIAIEAQMAEDDNAGPDLAKAARIALLSHLAATGWQVVPKVAAEAMVDAAVSTFIRENGGIEHAPFVTWGAMIAAAPKFGGSDEG